MREVIIALGSTVVILLVRWWKSPWCAVCYRGWAWRTRVVRRSWGIPDLMHVCARCAREIDQREASHAQ